MLTLTLYCVEAGVSRPATIEDLEIAQQWHVEDESLLIQTSVYNGRVIRKAEVEFMNDGRIRDVNVPAYQWATINAEELEELDGALDIVRSITIGYLPFNS